MGMEGVDQGRAEGSTPNPTTRRRAADGVGCTAAPRGLLSLALWSVEIVNLA